MITSNYLQQTANTCMTRETHRDFNVVSDVDEVIVEIAPKMAIEAIKLLPEHVVNDTVAALYLNGTSEEFNKFILNRKDFYLEELIIKPEYLDEYKDVIIETFIASQDSFYDNLELSEFGEFLKELHADNRIKKLTFLTHHPAKASIQSKQNLIAKHFPNSELIAVDHSSDKAKVMKHLDWDVFIEDRENTVKEVILSTANTVRGKELIILDYGYNTTDKAEYHHVSNYLGCNFSFISPYKKITTKLVNTSQV